MRTYEALYIVKPNLEDEEIQTVAQRVESLVTDQGGAIVRSDIWGNRRLAYQVKGFSEGCYVLLRFTAEPDFVDRLENHFRLADAVIRWLITHFDERTLRLEVEQRRRREEEIRASAEEARRRDERAAQRERERAQREDDVTVPVVAAPADTGDEDEQEEDEDEDLDEN